MTKAAQDNLGISEQSQESLIEIAAPKMFSEKVKEYKAFVDFCLTGDSLSELCLYYTKVAKDKGVRTVLTTNIRVLEQTAKKFFWVDRRSAYEAYRISRMETQLDLIDEVHQKRFADITSKALDRIEEMLDFPLARTEVAEVVEITADMVGQELVTKCTVMPADWTAGTIGTMMNAAVAVSKAREEREGRMISFLKKRGYVVQKDGRIQITAQEMVRKTNELAHIRPNSEAG